MSIARHAIGLAVAIGLLTALAAMPAVGAATWHPGVSIAPLASDPGAPAAALGERGEALGAWSALASRGRWRVEARTRRGYRSPWVPEPVSGSFSRPPSFVVAAIGPGGSSVIAWRVPGGSVRAATRERRRGAWSVLPVPSGPAAEASAGIWSPQMAIGPTGAATLVWAAHETGGWVVRGARRTGPGASWRATPPLTTGAFPTIGLAPSGDAVAAWNGPLSAALRAGTGAWGAVTTLSSTGYAPFAAIAGGGALLAWNEPPPTGFVPRTVALATGDPASGTWTPPTTVDAGPEPSVATDERGDALLTWAGGDWGAGSPFLATVRPAGAGWSAPQVLASGESLTASEADEAGVGMAPTGRAVVVVTDPEGPGSATTTLATTPIDGGSWETTHLGVGEDDPDVALATSRSGDLLALVRGSESSFGGGTIIAVSYDAAVRPAVGARMSGRRRADGTVSWVVTVRNTGTVVAQRVRLQLFGCCGAWLISSRPTGVPGAHASVEWRLGSLAPGRTATVRLRARASSSGTGRRLNGLVWAIAAPRVQVAGVARG